MATKNYTIIHGNVIYKVENVVYDSSPTHRRFKKVDGELVLSVPLNSVLVVNGREVSAKIVNGLNAPSTNIQPKEDLNQVIQEQQDDNFLEGAIVGTVIGSILF
jgi:hypothetical protein